MTDWNSFAEATWDSSGRRSATTRCFLVPYEDLARHGLGLVPLWNAVRPVPLPGEAQESGMPQPVLLTAQADPVERTVRRVEAAGFDWAAATAAVALEAPLALRARGDRFALDRIGVIDAVVSLLPYGYRATLTASTWAPDATADAPWICYTKASSPRRRVVDEDTPPDPVSPPARAHLARLRMLREELGTDGLLRALARRTAPASFPGDDGSRHRTGRRADAHGEG